MERGEVFAGEVADEGDVDVVVVVFVLCQGELRGHGAEDEDVEIGLHRGRDGWAAAGWESLIRVMRTGEVLVGEAAVQDGCREDATCLLYLGTSRDTIQKER